MTLLSTPNPQAPRARSNEEIAGSLQALADLLESHDANPFRIQAYRNAVKTLRNLERPVVEILDEKGCDGLRQLQGIGQSLARAIEQLARTGRLGLLERLRGESSPERILATVPLIGPKLAGQIHEQLGIETLEDLEAAAYDGRLASAPGFGMKRVRAVRESLAGRFRWRPQVPASRMRRQPDADMPPVSELLDIDREYRERAAARTLPRIAPRRFNPGRAAWLPVLHAHRGDRHYTALFSNTARAHELGTTHDWVVIYRDDHGGDGQWTVITARLGPLHGHRMVRGREHECRQYYEASPQS
jgi:hypothetical protein